MAGENDDSKDAFTLTSKTWDKRNKIYIQQLALMKKQAQAHSQQAAEHEQKQKLKLARRVLGTSFQRLYPRHAALLSGGAEGGASSHNAEEESVGALSAPPLERFASHSQIPKLPPLADAFETPDSNTDGALPASTSNPTSDDTPNAAIPQHPAPVTAGNNLGSKIPYGRDTAAVRRSGLNPLSRSVTSMMQGHSSASPYAPVEGSTGGQSRRAKLQGASTIHPEQSHTQYHSRRRRATVPDPSARMPLDESDVSDEVDEGDEEGPDVGYKDRRNARLEKTTTRRGVGPAGSGSGGAVMAPSGTSSRTSPAQASSGWALGTLKPFARMPAGGLPATPTGYAMWRTKSRVQEGQRTFCISGSGNHSQGIRAGLLARGWFENPEHNSPFFDFKWSANPLDINHELLWPGQIVNHFRHSTCLTTKHGLCHTIRETVWFETADPASFYPRAYDISSEDSRQEFLHDVRVTAAEALIKRALIDGAVCTTYVPYNSSKKATATSAGGSGSCATGSNGGNNGSQQQQGSLDPSGAVEGDSDQRQLRQHTDATPLVDLPSLRLACRVVAARLRQQHHLRVAHKGGRATAGRGSDPHPTDVELTTAQWQQLVRHRALSCSVPVFPQPKFNPSWISSRTFITSAMLPTATPRRGKGGDATGRKSPRRKGRRPGARRQGASPVRRCGGGEGGDSNSSEDEQAGSAVNEGAGNGTASDGEGSSDSDVERRGAVPSPVRFALGSASEPEVTTASKPPPPSMMTTHSASGAVAAARGREGGPVPVADAAELLREVYGKHRRWHSAPPTGTAADAEADAVGPSPFADPTTAGCIQAETEAGGSNGDDGGCTIGSGNQVSWLPQDLPSICYNDAALEALNEFTWRAAAEELLGALQSSAVQTHISGTNNIWIVKPAGKSRGRGIRLFNDPDVLLAYTRGEEAQGLEARWIAQKYVERPLIIERRKFDIRQWVLVTDWNPIQAWFYSTCYLRFAADDYDPNNLDIFQHLTNNSVSKYYEGPKKEDEITAAGNMWTIPRFRQWLADVYGRDDIWEVLLEPAMRHIVICTLKSAQDLITPRKGSCQLYGYDFLIDDQLRVWLLEINSSPTLEASTPITTQLCAEVQEDILKVVIDFPDRDAVAARAGRGGSSSSSGGGDTAAAAGVPDTGKWECIINGGEELKPPNYTGLNLELKGTAIHPPPNRSITVGRLHAAIRHQHPQQQQQASQQDTAQPHHRNQHHHSQQQQRQQQQQTPSQAPDERSWTSAEGAGSSSGAGDGSSGHRPVSSLSNARVSSPQSTRGLSMSSPTHRPSPAGGEDTLLQQPWLHLGYSGAAAAAAAAAATAIATGGDETNNNSGSGVPLLPYAILPSPISIHGYSSSLTPPPSRGLASRGRTPRVCMSPARTPVSAPFSTVLEPVASIPPPATAGPSMTWSDYALLAAASGGISGGATHGSARLTTMSRGELAVATLALGHGPTVSITIPVNSLVQEPLSPMATRMSLCARPGQTGSSTLGVRAR